MPRGHIVPGSNTDRVFKHLTEHGPLSIRELRIALSLPSSRVHQALKILHEYKRVFIVQWGISPCRRTVAIYQVGQGRDATRPDVVPNALVCKAYSARKAWGRTVGEVDKTLARRTQELEDYHAKAIGRLEKRLEILKEQLSDARSRRVKDLEEIVLAAEKAKSQLHLPDDYRIAQGAVSPFSLAGQLAAIQ